MPAFRFRCSQTVPGFVLCGMALLLTAASPLMAQPPGSESNGLVYFAGSVQSLIQGSAIVNLGDVHTLIRGDRVAVFRMTDGYFRPVGTLTVEAGHPDWFHATPQSSRGVQVGDIVVFVRTVAEIGQPEQHLKRFLATQHVKSTGRNGYSTVNHLDVAMSALSIREKHPRWIRSERRVVGVVLAEGEGPENEARLEPLARQVNMFRILDEEGIPASEAAGPDWQTVMTVLRGPAPEAEIVLTTATDETASDAATGPAESETVSAETIRALVDRELYDRNPEERNTVSVLLTTIMRKRVGDERLWLRRQLLQSQFERLADDDQMYFDVDKLSRQLRGGD